MAASAQLQKFRNEITQKLHEPNRVNNVLGQIEDKTGVDRFFMVAGLFGIIALYLIFGHFAELVCNLVGFLYPAYVSIKAIESSTKADDTQWLTYWVVFGLMKVIEFGSEQIEDFFPIYWLVKCAFMLWLYLPNTMGAQKIYTKFIRPYILRHQDVIDRGLKNASQAANKTADAVRDNLGDLQRKFE